MMSKLHERGFSLVEVAFSLILFTVIMLYVNSFFSMRGAHLQAKIMAEQVKKVGVALDAYAASLDASAEYPIEVKNDTLISRGFLSEADNLNATLLEHEDSYIFKAKNSFELIGVTFLCLNDLGEKRNIIARQLGFSGGVLNSLVVPGQIIGASGGWVIKKEQFKELFSNPLVTNDQDCIFNLSSFQPSTNGKGSLNGPTLNVDDISVTGLVAGEAVPLTEGTEWGPLFKDDALIINNKGVQKNILVHILDAADHKVLLSKIIDSEQNKIFLTKDYINRNIQIELIPLDDAGHHGKSVMMNEISIIPFRNQFWKHITFYIQANLYNSNFKLPSAPKGGTRSDIGTCSLPEDKFQTPAGIDVEGIKLDLVKSTNSAPYLLPHTVQLNVMGVGVLDLQIDNPSEVPENILTWGTLDIRNSHAPLIPGARVKGDGFYLLSSACKVSDSKAIMMSISADSMNYQLPVKIWRGDSPLWELIPVSE